MSPTSVGVAPSGECLQSKGRYGLCGWQVKLCDPLAIGPYLTTLEMRFMTKRSTNRHPVLFLLHNSHSSNYKVLLGKMHGANTKKFTHKNSTAANDGTPWPFMAISGEVVTSNF